MPDNPSPILKKPCLSCGELFSPPARGSARCALCLRDPKTGGRGTKEQQGYTKEFQRLSRRAKKLQPFCLWCSTTGSNSNPLTTDHSPEAWMKQQRGEKLTLDDVQVLCRECNSRKGAARQIRVRRF
ncbi:HNH endonuclease [uncultured Nocardioides sp.]|uniref:HNH endonuclease n=1 Tax=uncultured Nocardioides sp. TaxID=198441 RepID=UPI0034554189